MVSKIILPLLREKKILRYPTYRTDLVFPYTLLSITFLENDATKNIVDIQLLNMIRKFSTCMVNLSNILPSIVFTYLALNWHKLVI